MPASYNELIPTFTHPWCLASVDAGVTDVTRHTVQFLEEFLRPVAIEQQSTRCDMTQLVEVFRDSFPKDAEQSIKEEEVSSGGQLSSYLWSAVDEGG